MAERQNAWYEKSLPVFAQAKAEARQQRIPNERLTVMSIGALVTLLGMFAMRNGWRMMHALNKYEFEHTKSAGYSELASTICALCQQRAFVVLLNDPGIEARANPPLCDAGKHPGLGVLPTSHLLLGQDQIQHTEAELHAHARFVEQGRARACRPTQPSLYSVRPWSSALR